MDKLTQRHGLGEDDIRDWFFLQPNGYFGQFDEFGQYICNVNLAWGDVLEMNSEYYSLEERKALLKAAKNEYELPEIFRKKFDSGSRYEIAIARNTKSERVDETSSIKLQIAQDGNLSVTKRRKMIEELMVERHNRKRKCTGLYQLYMGENERIFLTVGLHNGKLCFSWNKEAVYAVSDFSFKSY